MTIQHLILSILIGVNWFTCNQVIAQDLDSLVGKTVQKLVDNTFLDDLEVVQQQRTEIRKIYRSMMQLRSEAMRKPSFSREISEDLMKKALVQIWNEVLIPDQRERFVQLVHQAELSQKSYGSWADFVSRRQEMLDLTEAQIRSLEKISKDREKELLEEVRRFSIRVDEILRADRDQAKAVLTPIQQEKLVNLLGSPKFGKQIGDAAMNIMGKYYFRVDEKKE